MDFDQPNINSETVTPAASEVAQAPVPPVMQTPVQPVTQTPVQPVMQTPVQPVMQTPVRPVAQTPVKQSRSQKKRPSYWALHYADNWSLVFGILSCISLGTIFPFSIIAIVISNISKKAIGTRKGSAKAGMIMGVITLILSIIWFFVMIAISIIFILNNLGVFG